jgi:hypothetical protein
VNSLSSAYARDHDTLIKSLDDLKTRVASNPPAVDVNAPSTCEHTTSCFGTAAQKDSKKTADAIKFKALTYREYANVGPLQEKSSYEKELKRIPKRDLTEDAILNALAFDNMAQRHDGVMDAHVKTFTWLFKSPETDVPWDSFVDWLTSGAGIYWVKGKAASGKSTLMKYILQHNSFHDHLQTWAGDGKFACAWFYFYHLGTSMQQSQTGLLRSLLHCIFRQHPQLI